MMEQTVDKAWVNQGKRLVKRLEKLNVRQSEQFEFLKSLYVANATARKVSEGRSMGLDPAAAMPLAVTAVKAKIDQIPELYGPLGRDLYMLSVHFGASPGRVKSFLDDSLIEFGLCTEAQSIAGIPDPNAGKFQNSPAHTKPFVDQESADRFPTGHRENY